MKVIAIIPARGGSKGIAGKNIRVLGDKPLIAHSIGQAIDSRLISGVFVSSDSEDILSISESYGAKTIRRPPEFAADTSSSESALRHALDWLKHNDQIPDYVVFLQCTSPFRKETDIDSAIERIIEEKSDSLLSLIPSHRFLWQDSLDGVKSINYDYQYRPRRQDMPIQYQENGSIYIFKPWVLETTDNRLGGKISMYVMDEMSAIDIDSEFDFALAENMNVLIQADKKP